MSEIVYEDVFNPKPFLDCVSRIEAHDESSSGDQVIRIPPWLIVIGCIGLGIVVISLKPKIEKWLDEKYASQQQRNISKQTR